jgi:hypothetical protein
MLCRMLQNHTLRNGEVVSKHRVLDLYSKIWCFEDVDTDPLRLRVCFGRIMNIVIKTGGWNELNICFIVKSNENRIKHFIVFK